MRIWSLCSICFTRVQSLLAAAKHCSEARALAPCSNLGQSERLPNGTGKLGQEAAAQRGGAATAAEAREKQKERKERAKNPLAGRKGVTEERWRGNVRDSAQERAAQQARLSLGAAPGAPETPAGLLPALSLVLLAALAAGICWVRWRSKQAPAETAPASAPQARADDSRQPPLPPDSEPHDSPGPDAQVLRTSADARTGRAAGKAGGKGGAQALGADWLQHSLALPAAPRAAAAAPAPSAAAPAATEASPECAEVARAAAGPASVSTEECRATEGCESFDGGDIKGRMASTERDLDRVKRENARLKQMVEAVSGMGKAGGAGGGAGAGAGGASGPRLSPAKSGAGPGVSSSLLAWAPASKGKVLPPQGVQGFARLDPLARLDP
jgi:hypothetical protein